MADKRIQGIASRLSGHRQKFLDKSRFRPHKRQRISSDSIAEPFQNSQNAPEEAHGRTTPIAPNNQHITLFPNPLP